MFSKLINFHTYRIIYIYFLHIIDCYWNTVDQYVQIIIYYIILHIIYILLLFLPSIKKHYYKYHIYEYSTFLETWMDNIITFKKSLNDVLKSKYILKSLFEYWWKERLPSVYYQKREKKFFNFEPLILSLNCNKIFIWIFGQKY